MAETHDILTQAIEPLCKATEHLLKPVKLLPSDRLEIGLDEEGECFVIQAYGLRSKVLYRLANQQGVAIGEPERTMASATAANNWVARVPERRELGYGRWALKATDFTAIIIHACWPRDRIEFLEGAETVYDYLLTRFLQQTVNAKRKAEFKVEGRIPPAPEGFFDHPRLPLTGFQQTMHHTCIDAEGAGFFAEQGTGKTPPTIRRFMHEGREVYKREGRMYRVIIVCPKNVRTNWKNEIRRFATTPGKVVILRGGPLERVKQLVEVMTADEDSEWCAVICSYETVGGQSWNAIRMVHWDLAVADESHYIKSVSALRTKTMMMLRNNARQRMALTGTPMANQILDLYYQLEFLGEGLSGFSNWKAFREYYQRYAKIKGNGGGRRLVGYENLPVLHERLARMAFIITKEEALPDLPEKMYDIEDIEMTELQREYYAKLQKELIVEIEADIARAESKGMNATLTATNILTKLLRLAQITAGYIVSDRVYSDDGENLVGSYEDRVHWFPENPKMDRIIEIAKEKGPKEKTLVWTCWVPVIHELSRRLEKEGIKHVCFYGGTKDSDRDAHVKAFNEDPSVRMFIGNPAAGGVGLNLPGYDPDTEGTKDDHGCNADHAIFYACDWSFIKRSQAEGRNHGKNRCRVPVRYTDLCVAGSIDEEIRVRVLGKQASALQVQDIREIMSRLLETPLITGD